MQRMAAKRHAIKRRDMFRSPWIPQGPVPWISTGTGARIEGKAGRHGGCGGGAYRNCPTVGNVSPFVAL